MPPPKQAVKRCPVDGCKVRLEGTSANTKCSKCGLAVCSNHIFPSDHTCISKAPQGPKQELIVEKKQPNAAPGLGLVVQKPSVNVAEVPATPVAKIGVPIVTSLGGDDVETLVNELVQAVRKGHLHVSSDSGRILQAIHYLLSTDFSDTSIIERSRTCVDRLVGMQCKEEVTGSIRKVLLENPPIDTLAPAWMVFAILAARGHADEEFYSDFDKACTLLEKKADPKSWSARVVAEFLRSRRLSSHSLSADDTRVHASVSSLVAKFERLNPGNAVLAKSLSYLVAGCMDGIGSHVAIPNFRLFTVVGDYHLLSLFEACAEICGQALEPFVWKWTKSVGDMLSAKYTKGEPETRTNALAAGRAICARTLGPVGIEEWVPNLVRGTRDPANWRTKEYCLDLLEQLISKKSGLLHDQLPGIVLALASSVVEAKKEVSVKASSALDAVGDSVTNPETKKLMPFLLDAIKRPDAGTDKCLAELMDATFVNSLNATSVALIVPVVTRALREGSADLKRRGAVATGNVCALVRDVEDVRPFSSTIRSELLKLMEHSSPEVRKAAEKAEVSLRKALEQADSMKRVPKSPRAAKEGQTVAKSCLEEMAEIMFLSSELRAYGLAALNMLVPKLMLMRARDLTIEFISKEVKSYFGFLSSQDIPTLASCVLGKLRKARADSFDQSDRAGDEDEQLLIDIPDMILAYASRVLLSKTHIRLKRGHRYGIVGKIGVGKTTLASRLAKGDLENFPSDVSTYMVLHEVLQEDMGKTVLDYMGGTSVAEETLKKVGFANPQTLVSTLSGGWRMRLAIAKSMLADADLIVLDEPTNHVDVDGCKWLASYLQGLKDMTCVIVSHDYDFLSVVATDILHIHDHKLDTFEGGFDDFQKAFPEIAAALPKMKTQGPNADEASVASSDMLSREPTPFQPAVDASTETGTAIFDILERQEHNPETVASLLQARSIPVITFPDPGKLEGVNSRGKPVMTVTDLTFSYPSNPDKVILNNVSCKLTLNSRVALRGANGQGKSTIMKLIVGELAMNEHSKGTVWKHHNLRVAYVAQHAIHHLMDHLDITPVQYLQRRYFEGRDKERGEMITLALDENDKKAMSERGEICGILSRVTRGKQLYYEIEVTGRRKVGEGGDGRPSRSQRLDDSANAKEFRSLAQLQGMNKPHVMKLVKMFDEELKYEASGLALRPVTQVEILKGLQEFGIDADFAERKIRWLSGGQKSRLVLAAAMWHRPHLICLDGTPTNFLDAETLAVLTYSLKTFKGAVLTISHHESFVRVLCNEAWDMNQGKLTVTILKEKLKFGGAIVGKTPSPAPEEEDKI